MASPEIIWLEKLFEKTVAMQDRQIDNLTKLMQEMNKSITEMRASMKCIDQVKEDLHELKEAAEDYRNLKNKSIGVLIGIGIIGGAIGSSVKSFMTSIFGGH